LGADKLIRRDLGDCEFYVAEIGNNDFLIAIYQGKEGLLREDLVTLFW